MSYLGSSAAPLPVAFAGVNGQSFNGGTNTFTLSRSVSKTTDIELVVNNVQQNPYDGSYSVNGNVLTTAETVSAGVANVYVAYLDAPLGSLSDPFGVKKAGDTLTGALNEAANVTLASAGTVAIGAAAANTINISGTTTITAFDTIAAGAVRRLVFAGALTLTHNATSLILPSAANITTAAGDAAELVSLGSGNWKCFTYTKANGQAVSAPTLATVATTGSYTDLTNKPTIGTGTVTSVSGTAGLTGTVTGSGSLSLDTSSLAIGAIAMVLVTSSGSTTVGGTISGSTCFYHSGGTMTDANYYTSAVMGQGGAFYGARHASNLAGNLIGRTTAFTENYGTPGTVIWSPLGGTWRVIGAWRSMGAWYDNSCGGNTTLFPLVLMQRIA